MPAAHEPAFIVNSKLGFEDAACTPKDASHRYLTSSPDSRSTSTGSSLSPLSNITDGELEADGLPDFEYPVPLFVRNGFIETGVGRPISLDGFFEERRVHSCPVESPPGLGNDEYYMPSAASPQVMMDRNAMMDSLWAAATSAGAATRAWIDGGNAPLPDRSPVLGGSQAPILRLADALPEPEVGSSQLPTTGSAGHLLGKCKPCAFYHTKGCGNGTQCSFCHLCPAGEKKRRQKTRA